MVQQRPLRVARLTFVELDERATDLHARGARGPRRNGVKAELLVRIGGLLRRARPERDVVEVVIDVRRGLDQAEPKTLAHVEVDLSVAGAVEREVVTELALGLLKTLDPHRDVLQRAR